MGVRTQNLSDQEPSLNTASFILALFFPSENIQVKACPIIWIKRLPGSFRSSEPVRRNCHSPKHDAVRTFFVVAPDILARLQKVDVVQLLFQLPPCNPVWYSCSFGSSCRTHGATFRHTRSSWTRCERGCRGGGKIPHNCPRVRSHHRLVLDATAHKAATSRVLPVNSCSLH